jgi:carbamoyl-phosphate synthase small subunit
VNKKAILALEDGSVFEGQSFGAATDTVGEVVFNTSMVGYQEILTDPSYAGQIVLPTYPLIGNYGVNELDIESKKIQVKGFIVREECLQPSHYLSGSTLHDYLASNGTPGIFGLDTRAITRKLRSQGVMMGVLTTEMIDNEALRYLKEQPKYGSLDLVREVTTADSFQWGPPCNTCYLESQCLSRDAASPELCGRKSVTNDKDLCKIVVLDCGLKYNILRILCRLGCTITVVPCTTSSAEILALKPDGILLSPGPGDPDILDYAAKTVRGLVGKKPIMGICLGNQMIHRAFGGKHFKLKFGHRGANHPVKEIATGKVHITAQNHGYAADPATLNKELEITHINLNDGTVEGLRHKELPIFAIQYHSEASPGPWDNVYLFEKFMGMVRGERNR